MEENCEHEKELDNKLKSLELYSKYYGKYNKEILHQHESLFGIYAHLNNITQGLAHIKEAIEISEKVFGEEHKKTKRLKSLIERAEKGEEINWCKE